MDPKATVEIDHEAKFQKLIEETAQKTKESLLEGLKEVFGDGDSNSEQMRILVRRIPILCTDIRNMKSDIAGINSNMRWAVRVVLGAVVLAVLKLVFLP
jgi:hypothetical protein